MDSNIPKILSKVWESMGTFEKYSCCKYKKYGFPKCSSLCTPGNPYLWLKNMYGDIYEQMILINLKISETSCLYRFWKDRHRKMMKVRLIKSCESWIWDHYLSKTWNGNDVIWPRYILKTCEDPITFQHSDSHTCALAAAPRRGPGPGPKFSKRAKSAEKFASKGVGLTKSPICKSRACDKSGMSNIRKPYNPRLVV